MSGLRVVKSVKRKKVKEIIHDANDVCKSAEIPSFLGSLDNYETSHIDCKGERILKRRKCVNRTDGEYFHD